MQKAFRCFAWVAFAAIVASTPLAGQGQAGGKLVVYGDTAIFLGPGKPGNCFTGNRFKRGEPIGFRMRPLSTPRASAIGRHRWSST